MLKMLVLLRVDGSPRCAADDEWQEMNRQVEIGSQKATMERP